MKEYKQECIDAEETDDVPVISNYIGECFSKDSTRIILSSKLYQLHL